MPTSHVPPTFVERLPEIRRTLRDADRLLVCLDFDGTLAPVVDDPNAAEMTAANRTAVAALAERPRIRTAIVSGRSLADVRRRVGLPIAYAGNHGLELLRADASSVAVHPVARSRARSVQRVCEVLETALDPFPGARVGCKILTGTVHLRSVPDAARPIVARLARSVVESIGGADLETSAGRCIVEFGPALDWGKGDAVDLLAADRPAETATIFVGDDVTDESGFRSVEPDGIGVHVGEPRATAASCRVDSPADVAAICHWLSTGGVDLLSTDRPEPARSSLPVRSD